MRTQPGINEAYEPTHEDIQTVAAIHRRQRNTSPLSTIEQVRRIVQTGAMHKVNGTMVDLTTAGVIVAVHDSPLVADEVRAKFAALPVAKMIKVAWKVVLP
jgi:hypothetical protein